MAYGTGGYRFFTSPPADNGTLTYSSTTSTFTYTTADG